VGGGGGDFGFVWGCCFFWGFGGRGLKVGGGVGKGIVEAPRGFCRVGVSVVEGGVFFFP